MGPLRPTLADVDHVRAMFSHVRPTLIGVDAFWADVDQVWAKFRQCWPTSAKVWLTLSKFDEIGAGVRPTSAELWPTFGTPAGPASAKLSPKLAETDQRSKIDHIEQCSAKYRPNLVELGQIWSDAGQIWGPPRPALADFDQVRAMFSDTLPDVWSLSSNLD